MQNTILIIKVSDVPKYEKLNMLDISIDSPMHITGSITHSKYLNLSSVSLNNVTTLIA